MIRMTLVAAMLTTVAPALASDQLELLVEQQLPRWGYSEVDVSRLTTGQLAQLHHIMHSDRSHSDKHSLIESVLRGSYYLERLPSVL